MQVKACHRYVSSLERKLLNKERTKVREGLSRWRLLTRGFRKRQTRSSAPDDALLIEEVIDDFDAIAHLDLSLFGHGENGTNQLA
jgi:hypothetical protein